MNKKFGYITILISSILFAGDIKLPVGMKATFFQKVTNQQRKVLKYSGSLLVWKNRIKWSYRKPSKKEVCSDGVRLVVVDHELETGGFYKMNKKLKFTKKVLRKW